MKETLVSPLPDAHEVYSNLKVKADAYKKQNGFTDNWRAEIPHDGDPRIRAWLIISKSDEVLNNIRRSIEGGG